MLLGMDRCLFIVAAILCLGLSAGCNGTSHEHGHSHPEEGEFERGPHGGRLLEEC